MTQMLNELSKLNSSFDFRPSIFTSSVIDRFLDGNTYTSLYEQVSFPKYDVVNLLNKKQELVGVKLSFAVAGFSKEDFSIKIVGNDLLLDIAKKEDLDEEIVVLHKGISKRAAKLSFRLGSDIVKESIKSAFIDGILSITLDVAKPESINVQIG